MFHKSWFSISRPMSCEAPHPVDSRWQAPFQSEGHTLPTEYPLIIDRIIGRALAGRPHQDILSPKRFRPVLEIRVAHGLQLAGGRQGGARRRGRLSSRRQRRLKLSSQGELDCSAALFGAQQDGDRRRVDVGEGQLVVDGRDLGAGLAQMHPRKRADLELDGHVAGLLEVDSQQVDD